MPFYERGDVRIRYEEAGSGFPLLVMPGAGLNSRVSHRPNAVFNSIEISRTNSAVSRWTSATRTAVSPADQSL
jgi:hypothetical protein